MSLFLRPRSHFRSSPRRYGYIPDTPDNRDRKYMAIRTTALPKSADLRPYFAPIAIEDQGNLGSCTANALAGAMEYAYHAQGPVATIDFSRLFIYYWERYMEGTVNQDAGAMIRDGIKVLASRGVPPEPIWPYNVDAFTNRPPGSVCDSAAHNKAVTYERVTSLTSLRVALSHGNPVTFGFSVYESFESDEVAATGRVPLPKRGLFNRERCLGGHAVLAVGYDDAMDYPHRTKSQQIGCVIVRNSWGSAWGDKGYFYLPYPFFTNPDLTQDLWTITKAAFA